MASVTRLRRGLPDWLPVRSPYQRRDQIIGLVTAEPGKIRPLIEVLQAEGHPKIRHSPDLESLIEGDKYDLVGLIFVDTEPPAKLPSCPILVLGTGFFTFCYQIGFSATKQEIGANRGSQTVVSRNKLGLAPYGVKILKKGRSGADLFFSTAQNRPAFGCRDRDHPEIGSFFSDLLKETLKT